MAELKEYSIYPQETIREVIDVLNGDVLDFHTYSPLYRYVFFGKDGSAFMELRIVALRGEVTTAMADEMVAELDEASGKPSPLTVDRRGADICYLYTMNIDEFLDRQFTDMARDILPTLRSINTLTLTRGFQDKYILSKAK